MRANWPLATSSTGGSGTLTLSAVTGWPNYTDVFGSSGSRYVEYEITEYTDATKAVPSKFESGIGSLNLATGVLTRTKIESTYDGATYKPGAAGTAPTALSFGSTAANISIFCGPSVRSFIPSQPFGNNFSGNGFAPFGMVSGYNDTNVSIDCTFGVAYYFNIIPPVRLAQITGISCRVIQAATGSTVTSLQAGIYEINSSGNPGKMLADFGSLGSLTAVATLSGTLATPIVNPGSCFIGLCGVIDGSTSPFLHGVRGITEVSVGFSNPGDPWGYNTPVGYPGVIALPDPAVVNGINSIPSIPLFGIW